MAAGRVCVGPGTSKPAACEVCVVETAVTREVGEEVAGVVTVTTGFELPGDFVPDEPDSPGRTTAKIAIARIATTTTPAIIIMFFGTGALVPGEGGAGGCRAGAPVSGSPAPIGGDGSAAKSGARISGVG